jgi:hypothetical protein
MLLPAAAPSRRRHRFPAMLKWKRATRHDTNDAALAKPPMPCLTAGPAAADHGRQALASASYRHSGAPNLNLDGQKVQHQFCFGCQRDLAVRLRPSVAEINSSHGGHFACADGLIEVSAELRPQKCGSIAALRSRLGYQFRFDRAARQRARV